MINRYEVESARDSIRAMFKVNIDYDDLEQEIMKDYQFGRINYSEFENKLAQLYIDIENEQKEIDEE